MQDRTARAFVVAELLVLVEFDREASEHSLAVPQSETVTVVAATVTAPTVTTGATQLSAEVEQATSSARRLAISHGEVWYIRRHSTTYHQSSCQRSRRRTVQPRRGRV